MLIYYPILSDHVALLIVILAIYAWATSRFTILLLLVIFSVWVMPGLFVVPFLLALMPVDRCVAFDCVRSGYNRAAFLLAFVAISSIFGCLIYAILAHPDDEILRHPQNLNMGLPDLKYWTVSLLALWFAGVAWIYARIFASVDSWKFLSVKNALFAVIALLVGVISIRFLIDWEQGFRGPPLFYYLTLQAVAAPLKPFVAHFLYFGPIFIAALFLCFLYGRGLGDLKGFPLFICLLAYLPILAMGSESRQWIAAFPVAVALVAINRFRYRLLLLFLFSALALCIPAMYLEGALAASFIDGQQKMDSLGWQFYFGRQGPWMSQRTYVIGLVSMLVFLVIYFFVAQRNEIERVINEKINFSE